MSAGSYQKVPFAELSRTRQNQEEPGRTRRNQAEPSRTKQNQAEPGGTKQNLLVRPATKRYLLPRVRPATTKRHLLLLGGRQLPKGTFCSLWAPGKRYLLRTPSGATLKCGWCLIFDSTELCSRLRCSVGALPAVWLSHQTCSLTRVFCPMGCRFK